MNIQSVCITLNHTHTHTQATQLTSDVLCDVVVDNFVLNRDFQCEFRGLIKESAWDECLAGQTPSAQK